jgi:RIO-like serine/threonine protein kinase
MHADLTPANVIVSPGGDLVPIDFQDTVLGDRARAMHGRARG